MHKVLIFIITVMFIVSACDLANAPRMILQILQVKQHLKLPESSLVFTRNLDAGGTTLIGIIGGIPERHSINLFRELLILPAEFYHDASLTDPDGVVYQYR